ncbi:MAG TPA: GNAT family N-acetyltransferase [Steroidobacter sp.]|uniref:GNAT family N-acetyltransferase n=1 Tax=Steroidobacter sp. TaxID=1978227 RepID=UPI002ED945C5
MAELAYTVRPARPDEARLLSDLALRSKAHWGYSAEFLAAVRNELSYRVEQIESADMSFTVLEVDGAPVGFYALKLLTATEVELDSLFVEPHFIGRGLGRKLIEHAKLAATGLGARRMIIQGDPNATAFYVAAGGVLTGTRESGSIPGRLLPTFAIELASE